MATPTTPGLQPPQASSPLDALALLGGLLAGKSISNSSAQNAVPPQLSQLLQMSVDRTAAQNPTASAANQGIFSMLPNFARNGITPPSPLSNQAPAPQSGGGFNPLAAAGLGAAGGAGLASLLGNGGQSGGALGPIVDALKKLFGGGSSPLSPVSGGPDQGPSQGQAGYKDPSMSGQDMNNWTNPMGTPPPLSNQWGGGGWGDQGPVQGGFGGGGEGDQGPLYYGNGGAP